jgi:hypothetical protein
MKPILLVLLAVLLAPLARADTITTTETVDVTVGCWDPAVCGDPAAFWNALDLPVPRCGTTRGRLRSYRRSATLHFLL